MSKAFCSLPLCFLLFLAAAGIAQYQSIGNLTASKPQGNQQIFKIHGQKVEPQQVTVVGSELVGQASAKALTGAGEGWAYEDDNALVSIRVPDQGTALRVEVER